MEAAISLSQDARSTVGVLLLTIVAVEYGGTFMLRVVRGRVEATEFQRSFFRAGHAHAGVLVVLAILAQILADAAGMHGLPATMARSGVPVAAILVPGGVLLLLRGTRGHEAEPIHRAPLPGGGSTGDRSGLARDRAPVGVNPEPERPSRRLEPPTARSSHKLLPAVRSRWSGR